MRVKEIYRVAALIGIAAFHYWQDNIPATIAFGALMYLLSEIAVDQHESNRK